MNNNNTLGTKEKGSDFNEPTQQKTIKTFKLWQGLVIIVISFSMLFLVGMLIGKSFYWNQFDKTPIVEKEYQQYLKLVQENPNDANNHIELGWRLFQKNQYNEALVEYKKAIDLDKNNFKGYYNLGLTYQKVGKNELAISSILQAIELAPKNYELHYTLGRLYADTEKYDQAIDELNTATTLNPSGTTQIAYALGQTYEKMGKVSEAKAQYSNVLQFDPKNPEASDALKRLGGQ